MHTFLQKNHNLTYVLHLGIYICYYKEIMLLFDIMFKY